MKTVYIDNSAIQKILEEGVLMNSLPLDIFRAIDSNRTPFGNNDSFPEIYNMPFLTKISNEYFNELKDELKGIGHIDEVESTDLESCLSELINKCREIEKPFRNELEKICFNTAIDLFDVPDDTIQLALSLVDKVDLGKKSIILDPEEGENELESIEDGENLKKEIYKRRILDALIMGASIKISSSVGLYENEINKLDSNLCELYHKIITLNNYLLFTKEDLGLTDTSKKQIGTVELEISSSNEKVKIDAQGVIFPILLSETIRGFMELFISHGLPKDKGKAIYLIGNTDYLKAEPWDMRIGPALWEILSSNFNDVDTTDIPYIMKRISTIKTIKFGTILKEIFGKTKKGRKFIEFIIQKAKEDSEYDEFSDKMSKKNNDSVITDEYIHINELKSWKERI